MSCRGLQKSGAFPGKDDELLWGNVKEQCNRRLLVLRYPLSSFVLKAEIRKLEDSGFPLSTPFGSITKNSPSGSFACISGSI